ncbi:unnamed protein product [Arctia plantaginis]|uniref:Uncharacterized protein n=1 Tax=Arctia plantaginis TaxID=874455 RepID=A0A8S0YMN9_ARCPL|nr:unnamed protein product [Arctia plantaginis]
MPMRAPPTVRLDPSGERAPPKPVEEQGLGLVQSHLETQPPDTLNDLGNPGRGPQGCLVVRLAARRHECVVRVAHDGDTIQEGTTKHPVVADVPQEWP